VYVITGTVLYVMMHERTLLAKIQIGVSALMAGKRIARATPLLISFTKAKSKMGLTTVTSLKKSIDK